MVSQGVRSGQVVSPTGAIFYWLRGNYSRAQIGRVLGKRANFRPLRYTIGPDASVPCGLAGGPAEERIYNDMKNFSVSKSYPGTRSIHVCRHVDGICVVASLTGVDCDEDYAREAWGMLKGRLRTCCQ